MLKSTLFLVMASSFLYGADNDKIAQGKYLVEEVGKCGECHTPMKEDGQLDLSKALKGATLPFSATNPPPKWHKTSPDITSTSRLFTRWKDEGMIKFLTTGTGPSGNPADPPMPAYHLKQADAEAIVAYLKSLP